MTNLADTFPFTGTIPNVSFPVYVGTSAPANPTVGGAWFNPTTNVLQVFTAAGWKPASSSSTGGGTLVGLSDVDAVGAIDGDTLIYDGRTNMWMAIPPDHDAGRY